MAQAINNQLDLHRQMFEHVTKEGQEMLESLPEGHERENLKDKLDTIRGKWDDLENKLSDHRAKLDEVKPTAKVYEDVSTPFIAWLGDAEDRVKKCDKIPSDQEEIIRAQETLEVGYYHIFNCFLARIDSVL